MVKLAADMVWLLPLEPGINFHPFLFSLIYSILAQHNDYSGSCQPQHSRWSSPPRMGWERLDRHQEKISYLWQIWRVCKVWFCKNVGRKGRKEFPKFYPTTMPGGRPSKKARTKSNLSGLRNHRGLLRVLSPNPKSVCCKKLLFVSFQKCKLWLSATVPFLRLLLFNRSLVSFLSFDLEFRRVFFTRPTTGVSIFLPKFASQYAKIPWISWSADHSEMGESDYKPLL